MSDPEPAKPMKKARAGALLFMLVYLALALACLRQWHGPNPWARLDLISGGYLILGVVWILLTMRWNWAVLQSKEVMREAAGSSYDPQLLWAVSLLSLLELAVFAYYGHWRLTPRLLIPALQSFGLALNALGAAWLHWTDGILTRHFAAGMTNRAVIREGPYRFVRHPRYVALLVSRISFALVFGSILAWGILLLWLVALLRRIRLEEAHLRGIFGAEYERYAVRTPRLVPGIY